MKSTDQHRLGSNGLHPRLSRVLYELATAPSPHHQGLFVVNPLRARVIDPIACVPQLPVQLWAAACFTPLSASFTAEI